MDFKTACQVLANQTLPALETKDTFLGRLRQQQPPVPGQVTSLLLALKVIEDGLRGADILDRQLAQSLFLAAYESRNLFEVGRAQRADWPSSMTLRASSSEVTCPGTGGCCCLSRPKKVSLV
ncbi:MAG: hypothetical protein AAFV46_10165, partial [Cyanobacteria bacterium J06635_11]